MMFRLQMTEAALALSEQKNHNMGELLMRVKAEKDEQRERQSRERRNEQEVSRHGERGNTAEISHFKWMLFASDSGRALCESRPPPRPVIS